MTLSIGDRIPNATLTTMTESGPQPVESGEALGKGTVVLFAVPGAFTPTCSDHHLPGFVLRADELLAKGVDRIACIAVNDSFVLDAWGKVRGVGDKILMLGDGNGQFTSAAGMELDGSGFGLGTRSKRYAAVLEDGVVKELFVEDDGVGVAVSTADAVLAKL
ncbi:peroxiredoxin [Pseudonocardia asaccharolytica]|uniref:Glutathione-dependent peroxiredoxin n=1 Tax=Pseudonocardia asaccharolytica DSM 44247 = NBRC 16224 TaxID=1123024 RepID=A0A511D7Y1_9PSEU|nr:peroxiredoxin [Pseudonocardia asaccharolytica]GEL20919.1 peroxiredoxin [Pseudonocardia asaccharolytica DSM 44247 = NBRC 16224]